MVDRCAAGVRRPPAARALTILVILLVTCGCSKSSSEPVKVADDFTGTGSLAFVEGGTTIHCFPTKAGATYTFTGQLENATNSSVQVEPVTAARFAVKFTDPSSEDTGAITYIAPHAAVPFLVTFVNKDQPASYSVDAFSPAITVDGHRSVQPVKFPYQVRFESAAAGSACTPKS
jgi:hypothetical protein